MREEDAEDRGSLLVVNAEGKSKRTVLMKELLMGSMIRLFS